MPALTARVALLATLGGLYVADTLQVAGGGAGAADLRVAIWFAGLWYPPLESPFRGLALLGGIELTTLLAVALALALRRRALPRDALAMLAFPLLVAVELMHKRLIHHPAPEGFGHGDGPSLSGLFAAPAPNSFPSGHMARTVLVYGLLAFVVPRLAGRGGLRVPAVAAAAVMIGVMAVDRLYLGVHWESDVVGGLLLGGAALTAALLWLERPRPATAGG